jgi:CRISPR system Cascade subunit CasA
MTDLIFSGDYPSKPAFQLRDEDGKEPVIVAEVLVRGQGKTDGYRERRIPVPAKARPKLFAAGGGELRGIARQRIDQAGKAQRSVLLPALCALLQGGAEKLDFKDSRARPWLERFDAEVDRVFFPDLWEAVGVTREEHERQWNGRLYTLAEEQLEHAMASAPVPLAQRPRAIARAELVFRGAARNHQLIPSRSRETAMEEGT